MSTIDKISKIQRVVLVCMTVVAGVSVLSYFMGDRSQEGWKLTTGSIVSAQFRSASADGIIRDGADAVDCPTLVYEYQVGGAVKQGKGPAPRDDCRNNAREEHRRLFAAGSKIRVMYDPKAPEKSTVLTLVY